MGTEHEREIRAEHFQNPDPTHETGDINVRGIFMFMLVLAVGTVILCIAVYGFMYGMDRQFASTEAKASPIADPNRKPPEPLLQPFPGASRGEVPDFGEYIAAKEQRLHSYGWVDQNTGTVHIPIEKAIDVIAQKGLPQRPLPTGPGSPNVERESPPPVERPGAQPQQPASGTAPNQPPKQRPH